MAAAYLVQNVASMVYKKERLMMCTFENLVRENSRHLATSREMTAEKRGQKFHTDDVSLARFG